MAKDKKRKSLLAAFKSRDLTQNHSNTKTDLKICSCELTFYANILERTIRETKTSECISQYMQSKTKRKIAHTKISFKYKIVIKNAFCLEVF